MASHISISYLRHLANVAPNEMDRWHMNAAAAEIERLRAALALAVGQMSTSGEFSYLSFDQLMQHFMEEARRD